MSIHDRTASIVAPNTSSSSKLRRYGAEVYEYPGENISLCGTGGPTCLTRPLFRCW
ncbi:hypothetical protein [Acetomicrobium mobile]|uniref:hypothetical protein n=1 Tax=Acetomicrobium mobile TaxID=97477 RepID=UPI00350E578B